MPKTSIAERLDKWRRSQGLKLSQIAGPLGISEKTVDNWTLGRGEPKATQLIDLEKKFPGFLKALGLNHRPPRKKATKKTEAKP